MKCRLFRGGIEDYLDGSAAGEVREAMDLHAGACPGCRRELEECRRLRELLVSGKPAPPPAEYFETFLPRWRREIASGETPSRRLPLPAFRPAWGWALGAAAAVLVLAVFPPWPSRQAGPSDLPDRFMIGRPDGDGTSSLSGAYTLDPALPGEGNYILASAVRSSSGPAYW